MDVRGYVDCPACKTKFLAPLDEKNGSYIGNCPFCKVRLRVTYAVSDKGVICWATRA